MYQSGADKYSDVLSVNFQASDYRQSCLLETLCCSWQTSLIITEMS